MFVDCSEFHEHHLCHQQKNEKKRLQISWLTIVVNILTTKSFKEKSSELFIAIELYKLHCYIFYQFWIAYFNFKQIRLRSC